MTRASFAPDLARAPRPTHDLVDGLPAQRGPIRAVCLDVDDTLVDYGRSMRAGLMEMLGHDEAWASWCALTERHYGRFTAGEIDFDTMRRERTRAFFAERGLLLGEDVVRELEERRMAAMRRAWQLFDDALPCLRRLRSAGLRLAVVTNAAGHHQRAKLAAVGLLDAFDVLVISGELGAAKPEPVIFRAACIALDVPPEQVVHVGDRLDLDALGARGAGLHGVWLDRSRAGGSTEVEDVPVIPDLAALPGLVAELGSGSRETCSQGRVIS